MKAPSSKSRQTRSKMSPEVLLERNPLYREVVVALTELGSPSYRQLLDYIGLSSLSHLKYLIDGLISYGMLEKHGFESRSLRVTAKGYAFSELQYVTCKSCNSTHSIEDLIALIESKD